MDNLDTQISYLNDLSSNLDKYLEEIVLKHKDKLISLIQLRLLNKGIDGDNKLLGEYSESTKAKKRKKGQISSHITLKNTGSFYAGMFLTLESNVITIDSKDRKTDLLTSKYGESILELTIAEGENFTEKTIDQEIQKLLDKMGDINITI